VNILAKTPPETGRHGTSKMDIREEKIDLHIAHLISTVEA
jgi:hypothetical protein